MSERKRSLVERMLDRMYDKYQTANLDEEPIGFLETKLIIHDKLERTVWWLASVFVVMLFACVGASAWLLYLDIVARDWFAAGVMAIALIACCWFVPGALRMRRHDLAQFAGMRAELVAQINLLKGQSDGAQ